MHSSTHSRVVWLALGFGSATVLVNYWLGIFSAAGAIVVALAAVGISWPLLILFAEGRVLEGVSLLGGMAAAGCVLVGLFSEPTSSAAAAVLLVGGLMLLVGLGVAWAVVLRSRPPQARKLPREGRD